MRFFDKILEAVICAMTVVFIWVFALRFIETFDFRHEVEPTEQLYTVVYSEEGNAYAYEFYATDAAQAIGQFVQEVPYVRYMDIVSVEVTTLP